MVVTLVTWRFKNDIRDLCSTDDFLTLLISLILLILLILLLLSVSYLIPSKRKFFSFFKSSFLKRKFLFHSTVAILNDFPSLMYKSRMLRIFKWIGMDAVGCKSLYVPIL